MKKILFIISFTFIFVVSFSQKTEKQGITFDQLQEFSSNDTNLLIVNIDGYGLRDYDYIQEKELIKSYLETKPFDELSSAAKETVLTKYMLSDSLSLIYLIGKGYSYNEAYTKVMSIYHNNMENCAVTYCNRSSDEYLFKVVFDFLGKTNAQNYVTSIESHRSFLCEYARLGYLGGDEVYGILDFFNDSTINYPISDTEGMLTKYGDQAHSKLSELLTNYILTGEKEAW